MKSAHRDSAKAKHPTCLKLQSAIKLNVPNQTVSLKSPILRRTGTTARLRTEEKDIATTEYALLKNSRKKNLPHLPDVLSLFSDKKQLIKVLFFSSML